MSSNWIRLALGLIAFSVIIAIVFFNTTNDNLTTPVTGSSINSASTRESNNRSHSTESLTSPRNEQKFETASQRQEAQELDSLDAFNAEIAQAKAKLDQETQAALAQEEDPDKLISDANKLLAELEQQGVELNYETQLLKPTTPNPTSAKVLEEIEGVEVDLIDIEARFNKLGKNTNSETSKP